MKLVITVEGGLVQDVISSVDKELEVIVCDLDCDMMADDEVVLINGGEEEIKAYIYTVPSIYNASKVQKLCNSM